ncbi:hypothetical protein BOO33_18640 [Vibrio navarrensis]|nr:hypothetical protein [Vibrio navarrensis]
MIIIEQLKKVKDTRSHINQVYPVMEVAFLVITAMICGQNKWTDIKDFGEGNIEWQGSRMLLTHLFIEFWDKIFRNRLN